MIGTIITVGVSFVGLSGLYAFKSYEISRGTYVFPKTRRALDEYALTLQQWLYVGWLFLTKLPHWVAYGSRRVAFIAALLIAAFARLVEDRSHRLARMIAHPYRRPRKKSHEDRGASPFIQEVVAHKQSLNSENSHPSDATQ